jgi:WD40 repeat protein
MSLNPVVQVDTSFLSDAAPTALAIGTGSPLTLAAAGADGNIRVVAPYAVPPKTLTANYGGTVTAIAFSPDLRFLVAGGDKGLVSFNTADGGKVAQFPFPAARYMAYPREDSILVATGLGILHAFSPAFGQRTEPFPRETVSSILESAGNAITATVNPDFIRLWKANDQSGDLKIGAKTTGEPKFSSSGKLLAARVVLSERPGQSAVRVWSTQTGAPVVTVEVSYDVVSFAFSPDETVLGIASTGTIELWPLDSTVKTPIGSIPSVSSIADIGFLPQGELLVAARSGGSFLTPWRRQDLIRGVCSVLTRNTALTPTELQTYGLDNNYRDYCAGKIPNIRY